MFIVFSPFHTIELKFVTSVCCPEFMFESVVWPVGVGTVPTVTAMTNSELIDILLTTLERLMAAWSDHVNTVMYLLLSSSEMPLPRSLHPHPPSECGLCCPKTKMEEYSFHYKVRKMKTIYRSKISIVIVNIRFWRIEKKNVTEFN